MCIILFCAYQTAEITKEEGISWIERGAHYEISDRRELSDDLSA